MPPWCLFGDVGWYWTRAAIKSQNGSVSNHTGHGLYLFFLHIPDSSLSTNPTH